MWGAILLFILSAIINGLLAKILILKDEKLMRYKGAVKAMKMHCEHLTKKQERLQDENRRYREWFELTRDREVY